MADLKISQLSAATAGMSVLDVATGAGNLLRVTGTYQV